MHVVVQQKHDWPSLPPLFLIANYLAIKTIMAPYSFDFKYIRGLPSFSAEAVLRNIEGPPSSNYLTYLDFVTFYCAMVEEKFS